MSEDRDSRMMSNRWALHNMLTRKEAHVVPLQDTKEHILDAKCWCHPEEDEEHEGLFVHTSMDGREEFERGLRQVS